MSDTTPICPLCESESVSTSQQEEKFEFGVGEPVTLSAMVDVHYCPDCDFRFTDDGASDARHDAACQYQHLMTPAAIRSIRESRGMSRVDFARATRIGAASLARWEKGLKFQNPAYDSFLYLLAIPGNLEALAQRDFNAKPTAKVEELEVVAESEIAVSTVTPKLRVVRPDEVQCAEASTFYLWNQPTEERALCM